VNLIYKIKLSPGANIDLKEALSYYSRISNTISRILIYFIDQFENEIHVLAVFNTHQNPDKLLERLK